MFVFIFEWICDVCVCFCIFLEKYYVVFHLFCSFNLLSMQRQRDIETESERKIEIDVLFIKWTYINHLIEEYLKDSKKFYIFIYLYSECVCLWKIYLQTQCVWTWKPEQVKAYVLLKGISNRCHSLLCVYHILFYVLTKSTINLRCCVM